LVAIVAGTGCCSAASTTVLWIDPVRRTVLRHEVLDGALVRVAKARNGGSHFRVLRGKAARLAEAYGTRAYVEVANRRRLQVVDLVRRRVVGERKQPVPPLLLDGAPTPSSTKTAVIGAGTR
jgi:hypothetical protein